jgi:hypothetical protein
MKRQIYLQAHNKPKKIWSAQDACDTKTYSGSWSLDHHVLRHVTFIDPVSKVSNFPHRKFQRKLFAHI